MRYKITKEVRDKAKEYEDDINKALTKKGKNYTNLSAEGRYYFGYIGEWAFSQFLKDNHINFTWKLIADGNSDYGDFIINGKIIDVKTASKSTHKNLMFPEKQLIHYRDIYVGCRINENFVEILGFMDRKIMENVPSKDFGYGVKTKSISLVELNKINDIIEEIYR